MRSGSSSRAVSIRIGTSERARIVAADVEAVLARQPDVEEHEADRVPVELDERLLAGAHPDDAIAVARQVAADELADRRLVLDEENGPGHAVKGTQRCTRMRTAGPPSIRIVMAFMPRRSWKIDVSTP